jgi:hypothetical protein
MLISKDIETQGIVSSSIKNISKSNYAHDSWNQRSSQLRFLLECAL